MNKFNIYVKSNKFYWSTNKIVYSIFFFLIISIFVKKKIFGGSEDDLFEQTMLGLGVIFVFVTLFIKLFNLGKYEPLQGNLEGTIQFEKDSIILNNVIIPLNEIKSIQITNDDYSGKLVNYSRGDFGPALSNGTNNFIILFLLSGETRKYQFELVNSNDFQKVRPELIYYHSQEKIEFWQLANVLGEKSSKEIAQLTKEIKEKGTTANTR